jgi:hypothetical protein
MNRLIGFIKLASERVGYGKIVAGALIVSSLTTGVYFKFFSSTVDHPIEQVAEEFLDEYGIEIDFSEDKKHKG